MNAGYPNNLFRAIYDTPPSPKTKIRSTVISSYTPTLFDILEISSTDWRNLSHSDFALYFRFNNEPLAVSLPSRLSR